MIRPQQLSHLVLRVRDLDRSEEFYTRVLGLKVTVRMPGRMVFLTAREDSSHELALVSLGPDAPGPDPNRVGLYHFAWQMASLEELRSLYRRLQEEGVTIVGIGDHGISLGVYFLDPDGNEMEAYYELPRERWPQGENIFAGSFPGSLDG